MDILNERERNEVKQYIEIFTGGVTEESTSGFSLFSWEIIIGEPEKCGSLFIY